MVVRRVFTVLDSYLIFISSITKTFRTECIVAEYRQHFEVWAVGSSHLHQNFLAGIALSLGEQRREA